jgi:hypothetical protein
MNSIDEAVIGGMARDLITSLEGVVVGTTLWLNGCNRVIIQPRYLIKGEPAKRFSIDVQQAEMLGTEKVIPVREVQAQGNGDLRLGVIAMDTVTGFKGVVVAETKWATGARTLAVQSQELQDGKMLDSEWFEDVSLKVLDKRSIFTEATEKPGGPFPEPGRGR